MNWFFFHARRVKIMKNKNILYSELKPHTWIEHTNKKQITINVVILIAYYCNYLHLMSAGKKRNVTLFYWRIFSACTERGKGRICGLWESGKNEIPTFSRKRFLPCARENECSWFFLVHDLNSSTEKFYSLVIFNPTVWFRITNSISSVVVALL